MYVFTPGTGFPSLLSKRSLENCSAVLHPPGIVDTFCTMLTRSDVLYPETRLSSMPATPFCLLIYYYYYHYHYHYHITIIKIIIIIIIKL